MQIGDAVDRSQGISHISGHILISGENHQCSRTATTRSDRHRRDGDPCGPKVLTDDTDHPGTIVVADHEHVG